MREQKGRQNDILATVLQHFSIPWLDITQSIKNQFSSWLISCKNGKLMLCQELLFSRVGNYYFNYSILLQILSGEVSLLSQFLKCSSFTYNILYQNSNPAKIILQLFAFYMLIFAQQILSILDIDLSFFWPLVLREYDSSIK